MCVCFYSLWDIFMSSGWSCVVSFLVHSVIFCPLRPSYFNPGSMLMPSGSVDLQFPCLPFISLQSCSCGREKKGPSCVHWLLKHCLLQIQRLKVLSTHLCDSWRLLQSLTSYGCFKDQYMARQLKTRTHEVSHAGSYSINLSGCE